MLYQPPEPRTTTPPPLRISARPYGLFTLEIGDVGAAELAGLLARTTEFAPGYFYQMPVVLDLSRLSLRPPDGVLALVDMVRSLGLVPAGFVAQRPDIRKVATAAGLPDLGAAVIAVTPAEHADGAARRPAMIIEAPVHCGQRIHAAGTDLVVLGNVSAGAELLADGCIHVHGALRGAAYAGLGDDPLARIFAKKMYAQRVAIAGLFLDAADFPADPAGQPTQVWIADGVLRLGPLP